MHLNRMRFHVYISLGICRSKKMGMPLSLQHGTHIQVRFMCREIIRNEKSPNEITQMNSVGERQSE